MESHISLPPASAVEYNIRYFFYNLKGFCVLFCSGLFFYPTFLPGEDFHCVLIRGLFVVERGVLVYVLIFTRTQNMLK